MNRLTRPYLAALCAALACTAALSAEPSAHQSSVDAAALQSMGKANQQTAAALAESASISAIADAKDCKTSECVVTVKAFAAITRIVGQLAGNAPGNAQPAPAPQIIQAQREVTVGERIVGLFAGGIGKIFDTAIALGPSYLNYRLGTVQSNNQTTLGIASSNNALAAQQSTNNTFGGFGNNLAATASAGFGTNATIAGSGFSAVSNVAASGFGAVRELGLRPTTQITGDNNALITGAGNTTQTGTGNRQGSAGPCTAGNGGNQTGTATPGTTTTTAATSTTTTPTTTGNGGTGGSSDCAK